MIYEIEMHKKKVIEKRKKMDLPSLDSSLDLELNKFEYQATDENVIKADDPNDPTKYHNRQLLTEISQYEGKKKRKAQREFDRYQKNPGRWYHCCKKRVKPPFENKEPIDFYIDEFWNHKCHDTYNVLKTNDTVRDLIHEILNCEKIEEEVDKPKEEAPEEDEKFVPPKGMVFRGGMKRDLAENGLDIHSQHEIYQNYL